MSTSHRWHYRAAHADGREVTGELSAPTAQDALTQLRTASLWVIHLESHDDTARSGPSSGLSAASLDTREHSRTLWTPSSWWARLSGQQAESLAVLVRGIATLLSAGVPIDKTLQHASTTAPEPWRAPLSRVRNAVRDGQPLSAACSAEAALPPMMGPTIAAAEATGTLPTAFVSLADYLERNAELQGRIRAALTYPVLLALSSAIATLVIVFVVVPRFSALLVDAGADLPFSTRLLVGVSAILSRWWWLWLGVIVSAPVLFRQWVRSPEGRRRWHTWRFGMPVWGNAEWHLDSARYLRTLALALTSGVSVLRAMALARHTVENGAFAERLEPVEARVRDGRPLGEAMGDLLPALPRQLLEAGEAAGALAPLAERAAAAAETEAQRTIARVVTLIEPLLILGLGGLVGFVALALLQAIYGLNAGGLP